MSTAKDKAILHVTKSLTIKHRIFYNRNPKRTPAKYTHNNYKTESGVIQYKMAKALRNLKQTISLQMLNVNIELASASEAMFEVSAFSARL